MFKSISQIRAAYFVEDDGKAICRVLKMKIAQDFARLEIELILLYSDITRTDYE